MAAGFGVGGVCYATSGLAALGYDSQNGHKIVQNGSCAYRLSSLTQDASGTWGGATSFVMEPLIPSDSCQASVYETTINFEDCTLITTTDVAEASWMVVACWLAVYAVKLTRRALP